MAIKLLHFPYVIQCGILRTTDYRDIFTLSVCSSKMHKIIKAVNLRVDEICYELDRDVMKVTTYNKRYESMLTLKTVLIFDGTKPTRHLKIDNKIINCTLNDYTIECLPVYPMIIQTAITNHIRGLFRSLPDITLEFSSFNVAFKLFPEIRHVTDSCLGEFTIDAPTIEQFISLYSNQKSITIKGTIEGQLQPNSALYQVENLYLHKSRHLAQTVLDNFTGRCLFLNGSSMGIPAADSIFRFMNQWISGEKYQNLKFLMIDLHEVSDVHRFDALIPIEFEAIMKEWDGLRRPKEFRYIPRMTLKLLQLPYLVQCVILRTTDFRDIFTLSACSSKMYRIIKTVNLKVNAIHYELDRETTKVFTYNLVNKHEQMLILKTVPSFDAAKPTRALKIGDKSITCTWNDYTIECLPVYPNIVQLAITNHISGLFKTSPEIDLEFSPPNVVLKLFPEIENVTDSCLGEFLIDTHTIEQFISLYPNQKSITIKGEIAGHFQPNSKLNQVENLYLHNSRNTAPTVLESFTGRCLYLHGARMEIPTEVSIVGFINQWKSGEKYQNLDVLIIDLHEYSDIHSFDETSILDVFNQIAKRWERRPENFSYPLRFLEFSRKHVVHADCVEYLDIQRESDGVWASFKVYEASFVFIVWK